MMTRETMISRRSLAAGLALSPLLLRQTARAQSPALTDLTLLDASERIRRRDLSSVDLTLAYLERIETINPIINAYVTVTAGLALEQAARLEVELDRGRWRGPLHGVPIALKDNIDTAGIPTTAASALFADRIPASDAEVYRRLKDAGAILLGKLNMHELAYGGTSAISHFGPVHNPWNLDYIPGGSSGGSAAATSARLCAASLGTDTLASIRLPAAYCGVVGFKPTHGFSSIRGIVPIAESLDHVGPITRTVGDTALMLQAMSGYDALDPVSIELPRQDLIDSLYRRTAPLRIGRPSAVFFESLDPDIARATAEALNLIGSMTGGIREVDLPGVPDFAPLLAEAYEYHEEHLNQRVQRSLYHPVTLDRILAAGEFTAPEYIAARRDLELARHQIASIFDQVDLIVTPTVAVMPSLIDEAEIPATASGAESTVRNTAPFNLFGIPTISIPCGFGRNGLPIGIQISGAHGNEGMVLALAHAYEQATSWHLQSPPLDR
jgi:aspartyl-tRNA(Asn)/glutamyl-tRNA(Gln) amidotransferase subunit A